MNTSITHYEDNAFDYKVNFRRTNHPTPAKRSLRPAYRRRRGKSPVSFNGIHRRRIKKVR